MSPVQSVTEVPVHSDRSGNVKTCDALGRYGDPHARRYQADDRNPLRSFQRNIGSEAISRADSQCALECQPCNAWGNRTNASSCNALGSIAACFIARR